MKTIGFIDYFLDEWHANEYPAMIRAYNERHGTDYQVKYAWAEKDASSGVTTDDWCEKYGAELPVFVTGDFNAYPGSDSIEAMKKVLPDSADVATVSATTGVNSFHRVPGQPCPEGTPIDFVFVTADAIRVLVHSIPTDETSLAISDHCPVYTDAKLN